VVTRKITNFMDVMLCSLVDSYQYFGGGCYLTPSRQMTVACQIRPQPVPSTSFQIRYSLIVLCDTIYTELLTVLLTHSGAVKPHISMKLVWCGRVW
jgi:hypothetical protein